MTGLFPLPLGIRKNNTGCCTHLPPGSWPAGTPQTGRSPDPWFSQTACCHSAPQPQPYPFSKNWYWNYCCASHPSHNVLSKIPSPQNFHSKSGSWHSWPDTADPVPRLRAGSRQWKPGPRNSPSSPDGISGSWPVSVSHNPSGLPVRAPV